MKAVATAAAFALALAASPVSATDHLQDGQRLVIKTSSAGGRLTFLTRVPAITLPESDPRVVGATLLVVNPDSGEQATLHLPPLGWSANTAGTQYRFQNPSAPVGLSNVRVAL